MRKIYRIAIALFLLMGIIVIGKDLLSEVFSQSESEYASEYILVLNRQDKSIEHKENHEDKAYPASLTKIMTTIVALEHIEDLSKVAPIDIETYRIMVEKNSSMAGFYGNEQVTYRDLLYGTILSSGGEAANSLAIHVAGSTENFVKLMNEKAKELDLENTKFTNPEGLHDKNQYTTAYDMAKLLDYALDDGDFRAIFTKERFNTISTLDHPNGILLESTVLTKLKDINSDRVSIIGGKSGTTGEAGQCWASLGLVDDNEYIVIVMGAPLNSLSNPNMVQRDDTIKLLERIK